jgi:predicted MFS family arabinose efflux permease
MVFGAAMPIALNQAASTALVQVAPARARQAIAILLLVTGVSSVFAWPLLIWLADALGWRGALVVFAVLNVVVSMPLHAWSLPGPEAGLRDRHDPAPASEHLARSPRPIRGAYALAAISFALGGMLTWGLPLHMVGILTGFGHDEKSAVAIGSLFGPGQMLARGVEMVGGSRFDILTVGVAAALLMPMALGALLAWGEVPAGAVAFAVIYGLSAGFISVVRAVGPLRLFGAAAYARMLGRLNLPQNIAFAVTPFGFAVIREGWGARLLIEISLALAILCLIATVLLYRRAMAAERGGTSEATR